MRDDVPPVGVSYVMPVLNEEQYVESAIDSVLAQDHPGPFEVVVALGPSSDDTDAIVERRRQGDPRIRVVRAPRAVIAAGLNCAVRAASYPVIVRVDAHAELPPDYTRRAVASLRSQNAANVGGIMVAAGRTPFQRAVARAYNSRWGLGGAPYHSVTAPPGEAESVYLGVFRADALASVGYFDENVGRGEDWELNHRLRCAGGRVWLDPALRVTYRPRARPSDLVRQFWSTGVWRAALVRRLGRANSMRYFVPPALVLTTVTAAGAGVAALRGRGGVSTAAVGGVAAAGLAGYGTLIGLVAARSPAPLRERLMFAGTLAAMHYSWGSGFLVGLLRGPGRTVDTSRLTRRAASTEDVVGTAAPGDQNAAVTVARNRSGCTRSQV